MGKSKKRPRGKDYYYSEVTQNKNKKRKIFKTINTLMKKKEKLDAKKVDNKIENEINRLEEICKTL